MSFAESGTLLGVGTTETNRLLELLWYNTTSDFDFDLDFDLEPCLDFELLLLFDLLPPSRARPPTNTTPPAAPARAPAHPRAPPAACTVLSSTVRTPDRAVADMLFESDGTIVGDHGQWESEEFWILK
jgi:hypothetical protein